jgi:hypothetical protein
MLVDVFLYAAEDRMLDLRVKTLEHVVDRFIGIVCERTHQNQEWDFGVAVEQLREQGADVFVFEPSQKLERGPGGAKGPIVWTREPSQRGPAGSPWFQHVERQHRNAARTALESRNITSSHHLVMVSDVDEIPDPHVVGDVLSILDVLPPGRAATCEQRFHSGALDVLHPQQPWYGTVICRASDVMPQLQRNARTTIGERHQEITPIPKAGVHLSWFGTDAERQWKLDSFSHAELRGKFDPAAARRTLTHSNGEELRRLSLAEMQRLWWPRPLLDGSFDPPRHWWADTTLAQNGWAS